MGPDRKDSLHHADPVSLVSLHGLTNSIEYKLWRSMKFRCDNESCKHYKNYGARGITYDPRWSQFANFISDMGRRPSKEYSLERIDNNGNYNKENCKWILRSLQQRNTRRNKLTEDMVRQMRMDYKNEGTSFTELAEKYKITASHVSNVIKEKSWANLDIRSVGG